MDRNELIKMDKEMLEYKQKSEKESRDNPMRAYRIKDVYLKTGAFKDNGQFDVGKQIAYEMEMDYRAMKHCLKTIREYLERMGNERTFDSKMLEITANFIEERIKEF